MQASLGRQPQRFPPLFNTLEPLSPPPRMSARDPVSTSPETTRQWGRLRAPASPFFVGALAPAPPQTPCRPSAGGASSAARSGNYPLPEPMFFTCLQCLVRFRPHPYRRPEEASAESSTVPYATRAYTDLTSFHRSNELPSCRWVSFVTNSVGAAGLRAQGSGPGPALSHARSHAIGGYSVVYQ